MKMISRTMQDKETGIHQWERFTVQGIPEECRPMSSFVSYYMLNILPRGTPMSRDALMPYIRTTDMVRVRGIGYSLNFVLMPKSGFRLRLLMFQTPHDMRQLSIDSDETLDENEPVISTKFS